MQKLASGLLDILRPPEEMGNSNAFIIVYCFSDTSMRACRVKIFQFVMEAMYFHRCVLCDLMIT